MLHIVNINPNPIPWTKNDKANSEKYLTNAAKQYGTEYKKAPTTPTDRIEYFLIRAFVINPASKKFDL